MKIPVEEGQGTNDTLFELGKYLQVSQNSQVLSTKKFPKILKRDDSVFHHREKFGISIKT